MLNGRSHRSGEPFVRKETYGFYWCWVYDSVLAGKVKLSQVDWVTGSWHAQSASGQDLLSPLIPKLFVTAQQTLTLEGYWDKGRRGGGTGKGEVQSTTCPPAFLEEQQEKVEQTELAYKGGLAHAHGDYTTTSRMRIDYEAT